MGRAQQLSDEERAAFLDYLSAELTVAAFQVVLQYGVCDQWVALELDLWETLSQAIDKRFNAMSTSFSENHLITAAIPDGCVAMHPPDRAKHSSQWD